MLVEQDFEYDLSDSMVKRSWSSGKFLSDFFSYLKFLHASTTPDFSFYQISKLYESFSRLMDIRTFLWLTERVMIVPHNTDEEESDLLPLNQSAKKPEIRFLESARNYF